MPFTGKLKHFNQHRLSDLTQLASVIMHIIGKYVLNYKENPTKYNDKES